MPRIAKTPIEIRKEATRLCRELAIDCARRGGNEQADALREAADDIMRMRLTKDI